VTITVAVVPDVRADDAAGGPCRALVVRAGADHACIVGRREYLARRLTYELARCRPRSRSTRRLAAC